MVINKYFRHLLVVGMTLAVAAYVVPRMAHAQPKPDTRKKVYGVQVDNSDDDRPRLGVYLTEFDDGIRRGMLVTGVRAGSPATKLGRDGRTWYLEEDVDVILAINGVPVKTVQSFRKELAAGGPTPTLRVYDQNANRVFYYKARLRQGYYGGIN